MNEVSNGIIPLRKEDGTWHIFLVLHKSGNHWGFPKGRLDENETPKENAKRELFEETGYQVKKFLQEQPLTEHYTFERKGNKIAKTVHYFPAIVTGALLLQKEELLDGKWFSLDHALEKLTFQEAKNICLQVIELMKHS